MTLRRVFVFFDRRVVAAGWSELLAAEPTISSGVVRRHLVQRHRDRVCVWSHHELCAGADIPRHPRVLGGVLVTALHGQHHPVHIAAPVQQTAPKVLVQEADTGVSGS